jgi:hypothetical protein
VTLLHRRERRRGAEPAPSGTAALSPRLPQATRQELRNWYRHHAETEDWLRYIRRVGSYALSVISSLDLVDEEGGKLNGLTWHVSVARIVGIGEREDGRVSVGRASDEDVLRVLRVFRMVGAEEDNHAVTDAGDGGNARHFWLHTNPAQRTDCECKATEVTVVDPDGYTFTRPRTDADTEGA